MQTFPLSFRNIADWAATKDSHVGQPQRAAPTDAIIFIKNNKNNFCKLKNTSTFARQNEIGRIYINYERSN